MTSLDYESDHSNAKKDLEKRFFEAATNGDTYTIKSMSKLLQTSISVDLRNAKGWTALMLSARNNHGDATTALLEAGADTGILNKSGQSALDIAYFWNNASSVNAIKKFLKPPSSPIKEFVNYFGLNSVDRQSYQRKDIEYISSLKQSPISKYLLFADLELLVTKKQEKPHRKSLNVIFLNWNQVKDLVKEKDLLPDVIYLGKGRIQDLNSAGDDIPYFAINFRNPPSMDQFDPDKLDGEFVGRGLMMGLMVLPQEVAGLVAQARSILAWHDRHQFCPTCGTKTELAESGYKRVCNNSDCKSLKGIHNTCFPRIDPVVIALVASPDGKRCLLGRQKRFPARTYSCLAGFMEAGESIEDAVRREVKEESGVTVGKLEYHSSQPWPFPGSLMIGFVGQATSDNITVDELELEDAKWFDRAEVAEALVEGYKRPSGLVIPPPYAIAHQLIKSWVKTSSNL